MTKPAILEKARSAFLGSRIYLMSVFLLFFSIGLLVVFGMVVGFSDNNLHLIGDNLDLRAANILPVGSVKAEGKAKQLVVEEKGISVPVVGAAAVLIQDLGTGRILYAKNIHTRLSPASTTKIMTALVALNHFKLGESLVVGSESLVGGSTMGLKAGESLTFRGLLYGMLLNSGNDAAFAIANNYPGGYDGFVQAMNKKVVELGLVNTHFENPAGFDGANHYSSAYDLSKIAQVAISSNQLAKIVATKQTEVLALDKSQAHNLSNLNQLLNEPGVIGIKTGTTEKAGENLIGLVEREGHQILTVVLGSSNRFKESKDLINWVYENFEWVER